MKTLYSALAGVALLVTLALAGPSTVAPTAVSATVEECQQIYQDPVEHPTTRSYETVLNQNVDETCFENGEDWSWVGKVWTITGWWYIECGSYTDWEDAQDAEQQWEESGELPSGKTCYKTEYIG